MGINLTKAVSLSPTNSWTDFYINMSAAMAEYDLRAHGFDAGKDALSTAAQVEALNTAVGSKADSVLKTFENANYDYWFAKTLTEEYDRVIRGGKTIVGGVPLKIGNTDAMQGILFGLLQKNRNDKKGDLLRDIGPAVQSYWIGAQTDKFQTPNIPCIGSIKNITTILGVNLSPGVWTSITIPPMPAVSPWLLNFILSANLHLLTVGGLFSCTCQYPPPAPPAPGVLPWAGYFVKPFSGNPLSSKESLIKVGTIIADELLKAKENEKV